MVILKQPIVKYYEKKAIVNIKLIFSKGNKIISRKVPIIMVISNGNCFCGAQNLNKIRGNLEFSISYF